MQSLTTSEIPYMRISLVPESTSHVLFCSDTTLLHCYIMYVKLTPTNGYCAMTCVVTTQREEPGVFEYSKNILELATPSSRKHSTTTSHHSNQSVRNDTGMINVATKSPEHRHRISRELIKQVNLYSNALTRCNVCLCGKFFIIKADKR